MHFSIPNTEELKDEKGSTYQAYNVNINGVLHCTVRYSQLYELNEQLRRAFTPSKIPDFPPKRLLSLTGNNLTERKIQLESYLQHLSQEEFLCESEEFVTFLHKAQQETQQEETLAVSLDIYLVNGKKFNVDVNSTEKTDDVLEICASELGLPEDKTYYFGLYLMHLDGNDKLSVVRKLQSFESPFISLKSLTDRRRHRLVIRKAYWDQMYDDHLLTNKITFNLLYTQAVHDVQSGWTIASKDVKKRITSLQKKGSKKECLTLCRTLNHYGYIQFEPCVTDFPKSKCRVIVSMGNCEVHFRVQVSKSEIKEATFSVTKMKCWRISCDFPEHKDLNKSQTSLQRPVLQLSFEYLVSKGTLKWISLISDQAIMMSMCIKDMVHELLNKRKGGRIRKPSDRNRTSVKPKFKPRDKNTEKLFESDDIVNKNKPPLKKISDDVMPKNINNNVSTNPNEVDVGMETDDMLDGIGDEDL